MTPGTHRQAARSGRVLAVLMGLTLLAACTSAATSAPLVSLPAASQPVATVAPAATGAVPTLSEATGVPTSLDPCVLVTAAEASTLAGTTFGPGVESTTSGNGRICTYGAQTLNVLNVDVVVAPDLATAQADQAAALADAQAAATGQFPGVNLVEAPLPSFADGGLVVTASGTVSGQTIGLSGIYVLSGTTFFSINDLSLGHAAPTSDALQAAAQVVIGRL